MIFSADETTDIGYESGTTVTPDYTAESSRFNGKIHWVQIDTGSGRSRPLHRPGGAPPGRDGEAVGLARSLESEGPAGAGPSSCPGQVNDSRSGDAIRCRTRPPRSRRSEAIVDQRVLVERARQGDHDAFAKLVDPALARLDAAARLILRDAELARDAVQETLIRAWRDLPGLRDPDRFDAWLHRLTVNACLDLARRRRRRPIEVELTAIDSPTTADHAGALADRELVDLRPSRPGSRASSGRRAALPAGDAAARGGGGPRHPARHGEVPAASRPRGDAPVGDAEPDPAPSPVPGGQVA